MAAVLAAEEVSSVFQLQQSKQVICDLVCSLSAKFIVSKNRAQRTLHNANCPGAFKYRSSIECSQQHTQSMLACMHRPTHSPASLSTLSLPALPVNKDRSGCCSAHPLAKTSTPIRKLQGASQPSGACKTGSPTTAVSASPCCPITSGRSSEPTVGAYSCHCNSTQPASIVQPSAELVCPACSSGLQTSVLYAPFLCCCADAAAHSAIYSAV